MKALSKPHSVPILTKPSHSNKCLLLGVADMLMMEKFKWHGIQTYLEGADSCYHHMSATQNSTSVNGAFKNLTLFIEFLLCVKYRASERIDMKMDNKCLRMTCSRKMEHGIYKEHWNEIWKPRCYFPFFKIILSFSGRHKCHSRES